jgi:hypothetical protein
VVAQLNRMECGTCSVPFLMPSALPWEERHQNLGAALPLLLCSLQAPGQGNNNTGGHKCNFLSLTGRTEPAGAANSSCHPSDGRGRSVSDQKEEAERAFFRKSPSEKLSLLLPPTRAAKKKNKSPRASASIPDHHRQPMNCGSE